MAEVKEKKIIHQWKQIFATICVSLGHASHGMALAWPSPALPQLLEPNDDLQVTVFEASVLASVVIGSSAIGHIGAGFMMDVLGRKRTLLLCSFPICFGYIMVAIARNFGTVAAGRGLIGLFTGLTHLSGTVYVSEISETEIRGTLLVLLFFSETTGNLIEFALGAITQDWRLMTWLSLPIPIVFSFTMLIMPESPRYLLGKNKEEKALQSLTWLRHDKSDAECELETIKLHMASETKIYKGLPPFKPYLFKVFLYGVILGGLHGVSGGRLLVTFAEMLSKELRTYISPKIVPVCLGFSEMSGQAVSMVTVEKLGRRNLLRLSGGGMFLLWILLLLYITFHPAELTEPSLYDIIPAVILILLIFSFNLGYRSAFYGLVAEMLPLEIRGKGSGSAFFICSVCMFVFAISALEVYDVINLNGIFIIFICTCFIAFVFPTLFVPETKGKSLEEIEVLIQEKGIFMGIN